MGNWTTKPEVKNGRKSEKLLSKLECVAIPTSNFVSTDKFCLNLNLLPQSPIECLELEDEKLPNEKLPVFLKQPIPIERPRSKSAPSLLYTKVNDAYIVEFNENSHKMELSKIRNSEKSKLQQIKNESRFATKKSILRIRTMNLKYRMKEDKLIKEFNNLCLLVQRNNMRRFQRECEYINKLFNEFKLAFCTVDLPLSMSYLQIFDDALQLLVLPDDDHHSLEAQMEILRITNTLRRSLNCILCEIYFKKTEKKRKTTKDTRKKNNKKKKQKNKKKKKKKKRKKNKSCSKTRNSQLVFIETFDEYKASEELIEEIEKLIQQFFAMLPVNIN